MSDGDPLDRPAVGFMALVATILEEHQGWRTNGIPDDVKSDMEQLQKIYDESRENADKPWLTSRPIYPVMANDEEGALACLIASLTFVPPKLR